MSRPTPVPSRLVQAAGSLVWRFTDPGKTAIPGESLKASETQVLIVHRPRYRDWSWPKGKAEANEPITAAAAREVEEETGVVAVLHAPLTTQRYRLESGQTKEVHYWVGTVAPGEAISPVTRSRIPVRPAPSFEIDQTRWASPAKADQPLARRGDRHLLSEFAARAQDGRLVTATMAMARHAKAISRHSQHESEATRPLTRVGTCQTIDLADLLSVFEIKECVSSSWTRCVQTLSPWAGLSGGGLSVRGELTETAVKGDLSAAGNMIAAPLRKIEVPMALCVHRPTIPALLRSLEAITPSSLACSFPNHNPWPTTAEILVTHISRADTEPHLLSFERHATRTKLLFGVWRPVFHGLRLCFFGFFRGTLLLVPHFQGRFRFGASTLWVHSSRRQSRG